MGSANRVVGTNQANTLSDLSASSSNSYGIEAAFRPSDKLSISGFVSYHDVSGFGAGDDYEAWSYGLGVALPDFGKKGNVLGIFAGAEPYSFNRQVLLVMISLITLKASTNIASQITSQSPLVSSG